MDLGQRALGRLHEADGVLHVALSLVETVDLATQTLADREAGRVVGGAVDPEARRQALHRGAELLLGPRQVAVGVERLHVVLNTKGHRSSSLMSSPSSDLLGRPLRGPSSSGRGTACGPGGGSWTDGLGTFRGI